MEAQQNALEVAPAPLKLEQEGPKIIRFSWKTSIEVFFGAGEETDFFSVLF
jgi:hypothetical protein